MNKKVIFIIIALVIIAIAFSIINKEEEVVKSPIDIEVGQEFTAIDYSTTKYVLNYKVSDLNGDAINDVVIFVGEKESVDSVSVTNADVVFYDGALQTYINADLKKFNGDNARLELADLTGDTYDDVVVILSNENDEKTIRVLTIADEKLKEIFKAKDNNYITFTGRFLDGFKVSVNNRKLNINKEIDLKNSSELLVENGVFDESGKYIINENTRIRTTGFTELDFVQLTGSMGIETKQRIVTYDNKTIVDEITIIWKYEEGKWQIKEATSVKMGNLLY